MRIEIRVDHSVEQSPYQYPLLAISRFCVPPRQPRLGQASADI